MKTHFFLKIRWHQTVSMVILLPHEYFSADCGPTILWLINIAVVSLCSWLSYKFSFIQMQKQPLSHCVTFFFFFYNMILILTTLRFLSQDSLHTLCYTTYSILKIMHTHLEAHHLHTKKEKLVHKKLTVTKDKKAKLWVRLIRVRA